MLGVQRVTVSYQYKYPVNTKHLYNVGPTSKTLGQRCAMFGVMMDNVKFPYFLFLTWLLIIRNREFRLYI